MSQVRSAVFYIWLFAVIAVMAVVCAPCLLLPRRALTTGQRVWAALVLGGLRVICGVRVEARGLEHRPPGPGLIAAKHQSMLDGIAPFAFLRDPSFVLKKELLANPVYGAYGRKAELVSLDREGGAAALKALITEVRDRLGKGRSVIIFPEGRGGPRWRARLQAGRGRCISRAGGTGGPDGDELGPAMACEGMGDAARRGDL